MLARRTIAGLAIAFTLLAGPRLAAAQTPDWQPLTPNAASAIPRTATGVAAVYDAKRDTIWVHCGTAGVPLTTFSVDPSTGVWAEAPWDTTAPPLDDQGAAAFDEARGRLVVVPAASTDVFEWDLATGTWSRQTPSGTGPGPRAFHALAYDPGLGEVVLFGGRTRTGGMFQDTVMGDLWGWDGAAWTQLSSRKGPGPLDSIALVGDPVRKTVRLIDAGGGQQGLEAWEWNGARRRWRQLGTQGTPPNDARNKTPMAGYDPGRGSVVYVGDVDTGAYDLRDDNTWSSSSFQANWQEMPNGGAGAFTYDTRRNRLVLVDWPPFRGVQMWTRDAGGASTSNGSTGTSTSTTGTSTSTTGTSTGTSSGFPSHAPDDGFEPNNTQAQAVHLAKGLYQGLVCNDDDWYSVSVGAGDSLTVDVDSSTLGLEVHDASGTLVAMGFPHRPTSAPGGSVLGTRATLDHPAAGEYFIRVFIPWNGAASAYGMNVALPGQNTAPIIAPIPDVTIHVGETVSFQVAVNDPDGDPVKLEMRWAPPGAGRAFDTTTGIFSWTPTDAGKFDVAFLASDGKATSTAIVSITILPSSPLPAWRAALPLGAFQRTAHVTVGVDAGDTDSGSSVGHPANVTLDFTLSGMNPGALTISAPGLNQQPEGVTVNDDGTFSMYWEVDDDRFGNPATSPFRDDVAQVLTESIKGHIAPGGVIVVDDYVWSGHADGQNGAPDHDAWQRATAIASGSLH